MESTGLFFKAGSLGCRGGSGDPTKVPVFVGEGSIRVAGHNAKPLGVAGYLAFPPHTTYRAALNEGGFVVVGQLDAFRNVSVSAKDEFDVVTAKDFANQMRVVDQSLRPLALAGICCELSPDREEWDVSGDDDRGPVAGLGQIGFEPLQLGIVDPAVVVPGFMIKGDRVEQDEMPASVVKTAIGGSLAVLLGEVGFAVFGGVFGELGLAGPTADVVVSNGMVCGEAQRLHGLIKAGPLFADGGGICLKGVHDLIATGQHKCGTFGQGVDGLDALAQSFGGAQLRGDVYVGEVCKTEGTERTRTLAGRPRAGDACCRGKPQQTPGESKQGAPGQRGRGGTGHVRRFATGASFATLDSCPWFPLA